MLPSKYLDLKYIREKYGVPAYLGVEIKPHNSPTETGTITGVDGAYIVTTFSGQPKTRVFHPTDVEYLNVKVI